MVAERETEAGARSVVALIPVLEADFNQSPTPDNSDGLSNPESELSDSLVANDNEVIAIPLIPTQGYVGGYTVSEQPIFWFYIPYVAENTLAQTSHPVADEPHNIRVGKFVLLDQNRNFISSHLMAIELLQSPRLMTFQLPFSLELNKLYNWYFSIVCEPEKPSKNPAVRGWVERIERSPELVSALQYASPSQEYLIYAENGIWFEALSELITSQQRLLSLEQARRAQVQQDWVEFLASVNILNPEMIDLSLSEPLQVKEDLRHQSQLPVRM
ncbi:MAG: DUF928 domain-containing protein [Leptolyngbyaceae cyanobacterium SM2_5_2]|nr:DUF928 domain-containing protein [Leptolyngbyaceae cyanobacterium SM2_5_2]